MKADKVLSMLGIAAKSGNVVSGEYQTEKAVKDKKARLVIVAVDASANTRKQFINMCEFYKVPYYEYGDKESIGHCIGKQFRSSLAVIDEGLAKAICKKFPEMTTE